MARWSAWFERARAALDSAASVATPLELSLLLSGLALVFLVAAQNHGELI